MAEKPLLKDLCRANKGNNSSRRIAEMSGVPEATVNGFFARASKDPSVYTVGPICRVCNVSLDEYFGIEIPDKTPENEHRIEVLEHDNAAVKRENELLERSYEAAPAGAAGKGQADLLPDLRRSDGDHRACPVFKA